MELRDRIKTHREWKESGGTGFFLDHLDSIKKNNAIGGPTKSLMQTRYEHPYIFPNIKTPIEGVGDFANLPNYESTSTHLMASANANNKEIAFPMVNYTDKLEYIPNAKVPYLNDPVRMALRTRDYREFNTQQEADAYASNGYKRGTKLENHATGGSMTPPPPVDPVVFEDKNDPEYIRRSQAYNDSLKLYNLSQRNLNIFNKDSNDKRLPKYNKEASDLAKKSNITPNTVHLDNNYTDFKWTKDWDNNKYMLETPWLTLFKKPVQKVELKQDNTDFKNAIDFTYGKPESLQKILPRKSKLPIDIKEQVINNYRSNIPLNNFVKGTNYGGHANFENNPNVLNSNISEFAKKDLQYKEFNKLRNPDRLKELLKLYTQQ